MDKTKKRRIQILAASVFWLGVWQAAAVAIGQEVFLVSPVQAIGTLVELLPQAEFWQRIGFSAGRILLGFGLGVVVSVFLAAAAQAWHAAEVLLAPVLYLFLKNIWTGAAFLLVLLVALFKGVALPELNLDALIYYSFAAYAALHGRKWAEAVWSWKRAALGVCLLAVGIVLSRSYYTHYFVPGIVLYQLLAVIGIWMMVNERWLGEVRPFMTCTFFIYATHFVVVRFLNKAAALLFPGSQLVSMFMYVCMPLLAVTLCYQAARVLRRYRPDIWKTLNGGR